MIRTTILAFALLTTAAHAHLFWANGEPVPSYIQRSCCGPGDAHHLRPDQVHAMPDGWHIDGLKQVVPYGRELPSQDGEIWAFWRVHADGTESPVFCFFRPDSGV